MRRSLARFLAVPTVAIGIAAGVTVAAPAAFAQSDTSGTVAITVPFSFINQLSNAGITTFVKPRSEESINNSNQTATATFNVTGGDGDVSTFFGQVDMNGSIVIDAGNGHKVTVSNLDLNVANGVIEGTPSGSSTPVALLDVTGNVAFSVNGTSEAYSTDALAVDPAGAAFMNNALSTNAFVAGENTGGSLAASWTFQ